MAEHSYSELKYYNKDGAIAPDLVTTMAQEWADRFVPNGAAGAMKATQPRGGYGRSDGPGRSGSDKPMKSTQLRRFYGDVKSLEMRWQKSTDKARAFLDILPMIKLLKAKAAYAHNRELVPSSFRDWIWENVDRINNEKDFRAFLLHFEAVVGFCYGNGIRDN